MTEFHRFGALWRVNSSKKGHQFRALWATFLCIRTGNLMLPCREFKSVIREISGLIRDPARVRYFGPTNPIARTGVRRRHAIRRPQLHRLCHPSRTARILVLCHRQIFPEACI